MGTLLNHEGLLSSIIQWGFWYEYRFDILNELSEVTNIVDSGRIIAKILVRDAHNRARRSVTTDGKDRLLMLGTTPIINKEFAPMCERMFDNLHSIIRHGGTFSEPIIPSRMVRQIASQLIAVEGSPFDWV